MPGAPVYYATSLELMGLSAGLLVKSYDGRPIKVEGNPDHPSSLGGCGVFAQASLLDLYDPDRSKTPTHDGAPVVIEDVIRAVRKMLDQARGNCGAGLFHGSTRMLTVMVNGRGVAELLQIKRPHRLEHFRQHWRGGIVVQINAAHKSILRLYSARSHLDGALIKERRIRKACATAGLEIKLFFRVIV